MDAEAAFNEVRNEIAAGRTEGIGTRIVEIAEGSKDPYTLIKCMSLLKVVDDPGSLNSVVRILMGNLPEDPEARCEIAVSLKGLGCPVEAYDVLKGMEATDKVLRVRSLCLMEMEEYESAYDALLGISKPTPYDRLILTEALSSIGEHAKAIDNASALLKEFPGDYEVRKSYVSALIVGGRDKEAVKYARGGIKDKTADSNAIAGYVMRVLGNTKAAAGFASRAVQLDNKHVGGMETLGICLAEKGEYDKARIVAGAINEASPGNKAAFNVLSYCNGH